MTLVLQTVVAEFIDGVVRAYGPFVIPVAFFVAGAVGYVVLVALGRAGIGEGLTEARADDSDDPTDPTEDEADR
ncbi:hypothetical protein SAMN04487947_1601 [Halogeometricum rufum]|jgi:hypothetical protein|uniref:Uncharacterized protein n=1 Tax=Halogeometricum rufum TaxID=553469 RepID=A0A1I6GSK0_9EURY|nr:hypothetical protein [Halogeometricum rufum]SFR45192.1 hypothetical protein SAMN04487947_1601 [Halogeometricum rufum]